MLPPGCDVCELQGAIAQDQASQHLSMDGEEAHEALAHRGRATEC